MSLLVTSSYIKGKLNVITGSFGSGTITTSGNIRIGSTKSLIVDNINSSTTNGNLTLNGNGSGNVFINDNLIVKNNLNCSGIIKIGTISTLTGNLNLTTSLSGSTIIIPNGRTTDFTLPYCCSYLWTSSVTSVTNSPTKFNPSSPTLVYDTSPTSNSRMSSSSTSGSITIRRSGYYLIGAGIYFSSQSGKNILYVDIAGNYRVLQIDRGGGSNTDIYMSGCLSYGLLNVNDTIFIRYFTTVSCTIGDSSSSNPDIRTRLYVHYIGQSV